MEFRVQLASPAPDSERLGELLEAEDPAASSELDQAVLVWRVNDLPPNAVPVIAVKALG
jgi:hypothetical protein